MRRWLLAPFLGGLLNTATGANLSCPKALRVLTNPEQLTSIELELPATKELYELIETRDGTVGPVLGKRAAPKWVEERA